MKLEDLLEARAKHHVYKNTMLGGKDQRVFNVAYNDKLVGHVTKNKDEDHWWWKMYEPNNRNPAKGTEYSKAAAVRAVVDRVKDK